MKLSLMQRVGVMIALVLAVVGTTTVMSASTASAVSAGCSAGRCTVYLSKADTAALGQARVPAPPAAVPLPLKVAYYALAYGHVWIAKQYAARGWCSAFLLSPYPWENQGYVGYRC